MPSTYQQINTDPGKTVLLVQPTTWTVATVTCETVGPAIIGSSPDLKPGTGQGVLLTPTPRTLYLEPGDALYVYSEGADRVNIAMHTLSWLSQLMRMLGDKGGGLAPTPQPTRGVELNWPGKVR